MFLDTDTVLKNEHHLIDFDTCHIGLREVGLSHRTILQHHMTSYTHWVPDQDTAVCHRTYKFKAQPPSVTETPNATPIDLNVNGNLKHLSYLCMWF